MRAASWVVLALLLLCSACGSTQQADGAQLPGGCGTEASGSQCDMQPSCADLATTCGIVGNTNCCASVALPGGTFNRNNLADFPATVSAFRLDTYEVTVGRFRRFVAAYHPGMILPGSGKNPNNPSDFGWNTAWNTGLPVNSAALQVEVSCSANFQTWTDAVGPNENRPINCVDWYVAQAFCIWDGGRLPTEAEWNFVAAGGSDQREYPWGATAPEKNANLAVFKCHYNGDGTCTNASSIAPVGSVVAGNGKWGHSDLAGNVWEWTQDWLGTYSTPCIDCASLSVPAGRVMRGGSFSGYASHLTTFDRYANTEAHISHEIGVRCARPERAPRAP